MKLLIISAILLIVIIASVMESIYPVTTDTPQSADMIIMVGGDDGRMQKAAELYHDGYADYVLITPVSEIYYSQSIEFAIALGIPKDMIIEETEATSTYTNATESLGIMREMEMESALVVTSDYHMKRTKMIFDRVTAGSYDLTYISARDSDGRHWYEKSNAFSLWFREYYNLWGYRLGLYKIDVFIINLLSNGYTNYMTNEYSVYLGGIINESH